MKARSIFIALGALVVLPAFAAADTYSIDPEHSYPFFEVGHMGFSTLRGKFGKMQGKVTLDRAAKSGSIDVDIDTSTIDSGLPKRDSVLKGENWFNAAKYPSMTFKSNSLKFQGDQLVGVEGELTMRGVSQPVTLTVDAFRCGPNPFNKVEMCGGSASTTIKRSAFGLTASSASVGDDVKILVSFEAHKG